MFSTILADLRASARSARRQPGFTAVVVFTLALGIGTTTAMFALAHATLLKPLPYTDPDRLVLARRTVGSQTVMWSSAPDYYDYREQAAGFETLARTSATTRRVTVAGAERPERLSATLVSDDLFRMLGMAPVAGRSFTVEEAMAGAPYVVMVSEGYARRRFGDADAAVGRSLSVTGIARQNVAATIVGVMPTGFRFLDPVDLWGVIRRGENDGPETRQFHNWVLVGRLRRGVSIETAQGQVDVVSHRLQRLYPATNKTKGLRLDRLQAALFEPQTPRLVMLTCAVGLLLLIACANVAGLLLARGAARRPEFALRAALGASRARIACQLLTESLSLAAVAGLAGVSLAVWLQRVLPIATGLADSGVEPPGLEWRILLLALLISVGTGIAAGVAPALRASNQRPGRDLAPGSRSTDSGGSTRLRSLLVAGQVSVTLVLLIGAGLLIRSFTKLTQVDLGFDPHQVLTGQLSLPYTDPGRCASFFEGLRDDVAAMPGVTATSFTSHVPVRDPAGDPPVWADGRPPVDASQMQSAALRYVLPGYLDTLRIPLVAGRDLSATDREGTRRVLVINQAMARVLFPGEDPLGKHVMMATSGPEPLALEVVGIAGDARIYGVGARAPMTMYVPIRQLPRTSSNLVVRTELDPRSLASAVRALVAKRDRDVAVENLASLDETIGESLVPERVTTITLGLFSALALLLASLGLYGVLAYHVTRRTQEIGVRIALGASTRAILSQVLARSGLMVIPGVVVGIAGALAATRLMNGLLYGVVPNDPIALAFATTGLVVVALGASALPAWRAARVDPVQALRGE